MPELTFDRLCDFLATTHGGYTVWVGAGAAIALTKGATPSWRDLISRLTSGHALPGTWESMGYPSRLDWVASKLGHAAFRRALRMAVVEPMLASQIDEQVAKDMAIIGVRAGALVSFNIERLSALPLSMGRGGSFIARAYRRPDSEPLFRPWSDAGVVCSAVFFPHGLLDFEGNCVITRSEYDAQSISLAVGTAVNLCLGGDLLILGMSLDDSYLRDGILQHRRWIRDIFWVDDHFEHPEWARLARVHCVTAPHTDIWSGIANAHLRFDTRKEIVELCEGPRGLTRRAVQAIGRARKYLRQFEAEFATTGNELQEKAYKPADYFRFSRQCADLGFEVPDHVKTDARFDLGWTEGLEPPPDMVAPSVPRKD